MLDNNKTMQEIYSICKKFEEMRQFSKRSLSTVRNYNF